jgi:hypothetical protein
MLIIKDATLTVRSINEKMCQTVTYIFQFYDKSCMMIKQLNTILDVSLL